MLGEVASTAHVCKNFNRYFRRRQGIQTTRRLLQQNTERGRNHAGPCVQIDRYYNKNEIGSVTEKDKMLKEGSRMEWQTET